MTASKSVRAALSRSARSAVTEVLHSMARYHLKSRWLGTTNRYLHKTTSRLKTDSKSSSGLISAKQKQLREYIAASAPLHCTDGWSFLGRSVEALLRGDVHTARHMAYYSELRAAMALLAAEGVGVFDNLHFVIDAQGAIVKIKSGGPTHNFTWDALDWWSTNKRASARLGSIIRPYNSPFTSWVNPYPGLVAAVARNWLRDWGLELQRFRYDRDARNLASYRPQALTGAPSLGPAHALSFVTSMWLALEPHNGNRFDGIDRYLLRTSIEKSNHPDSIAARSAKICNWMPTDSVTPDQLDKFLLRTEAPDDPPILLLASKKDLPHSRDHPLQVISRAALLLRVATGSVLELFAEANVSADSIAFWAHELARSRGVLRKDDAPGDPADYWADISESIAIAQQWLLQPDEQRNELAGLLSSETSSALWMFGGCERIALWNFAA